MKKIIIITALILCLVYPLFSAVTSIEVRRVGSSWQYMEAGTLNNPVLNFKINAQGGDTLTELGVHNVLNSLLMGAVSETASIPDGGIKIWYSSDGNDDFESSSPSYVTHLPRDVSDASWWYNTFSQPVTDGSQIWVTADIQQSPVPGTMEMQTEHIVFSGSVLTSSNEPPNPYVLLVTSYTQALGLEVLHEPGSIQSTVSTAQSYLIPVVYKLFNNSPDTAADITVNLMRLKIQSFPVPGTILSPSSIIKSIKIQDRDQGTIYGELLPGAIPSDEAPFDIPISQMDIPPGITITANAVIEIADNAGAAGTEFVISLDSAACISAYDYYTVKRVPAQPSALDSTGFAMDSKQLKIQKKLDNINAWYEKILPEPQNINKGATNVDLLKIGLENPGDTNTASAEVYNIKIYVEDSAGAPIVPRDIFSKISVTDESGSVKYRVKSFDTIETSGNTINFSLTTAIDIDGASRVTAVVKADISPSTAINSFKIRLASASDISCRDKNSFSSASVASAPLPFYSSLALLSSSFTLAHQARMPSNIYKGQKNIHAMSLLMSAPLSFGNGNIIVRGISITAKNSSGQDILMSSVMSGMHLVGAGLYAAVTSMPAASTQYFAFPYDLTVTAVPGANASVFADILDNPSSDSLQLQVSADTAISAYQDNDPLRQVFIAPAAGESFPMSSGTGYIGGNSAGLSFSAYPVPFGKTQPCRLGYYLFASAKVTIRIYDVMGNLVKTIIENSPKTAGSHSEDTWNGTDKNNRIALSGAYIAKIDAGSRSAVSKAVFIK
jgi:hypothetical protein